MTERVLDISDQPAWLSVRNSCLVVQFREARLSLAERDGKAQKVKPSEPRTKYRCEELFDPNEFTIPLADVAVLIVSHPQVTYSQAVLSGLATAGASFVACDTKHQPVSMLLPLIAHSLQTERFSAQAAASLPLRKRLWQQIVQAKIQAQASLLQEQKGTDAGLKRMAESVRSGDPSNVEAQAARIYWRELFSEFEFRRDVNGEGLNGYLNYGYAVLRATVARALCGAGLHPGLPLHHHNRYDPFCLADDLMEPYRPLVDRAVVSLGESRAENLALDKEAKQAVIEVLLGRFTADGESRTLFDWMGRASSSLAEVVLGRKKKLILPCL